MFEFYANKNKLDIRQREQVTSGSVNVYRARFSFSPDWEGLTRTAVFRGGGAAVSVPLDQDGACDVPWEALAKPHVHLQAGVYGARGEDVALPTVWADCGFILEGVTAGEAARPPAPVDSGGTSYAFGHGLKVDQAARTVSVDAVDSFDGDNTLPITASAVQTAVGNIDILLQTI